MRLIWLLLLVYLPQLAIGQDWEWVKAAGGDKPSGAIRMNQGTGICTDQNGNVYVAGFFAGTGVFGSDTLATWGSTDPLVVKYDSAGRVLWARKITQGQADYCYGICLDRADNIILTGIESGNIISGFTAKYTTYGELQWIRETWGEDCSTNLRAVAADVVGNIYVAGDCMGVTELTENISVGTPGKYTVFVVKYDVLGQVMWVKQSAPADSFFTQAKALNIDANENVCLAGTFTDELTIDSTTLTGKGGRDIFIARLTSDGRLQWAKSWGSKGTDVVRSITTDYNGYIYLTAFFSGEYHTKGKTMTGENLLKLSDAGEPVWNLPIGQADHYYDIASYVCAANDGELYLTGNTYGMIPLLGDGQAVCMGASDIFVARCSRDGKVLWKVQAGGAGVDEGDAICTDDTHVYVTGYFHSVADFGRLTIHSVSGDDGIWVGKLWRWK